jgi:hypothetical protein
VVLESLRMCWNNTGWTVVDKGCKLVHWSGVGALLGMLECTEGALHKPYWLLDGVWFARLVFEVMLEILGMWWSTTGWIWWVLDANQFTGLLLGQYMVVQA